MLKTLFGQKYTQKFIDRVAWRKAQYYENRRLKTIRENATKMAFNWSHEYPTGTPIEYIRDDIIEMWERSEGVGIFSNLDKEQNIPVASSHMEAVQTMAEKYPQPVRGTRKNPKAQATIKKYKHEWRNPPDEENND